MPDFAEQPNFANRQLARLEGELYHYQDYDGDDFDAVIQTPDNGWSAFEIKLDPGQVDEAATSLVRIASKFKHFRRRSCADGE